MLGGWRFVSSLGLPELYEPSSSSKVRCWPRLPQTQCLCLFSACPPTRLGMRHRGPCCSIPSSPCLPSDAPRLLTPTAGSIRRQPGSGGCRSAQGGARAIGSLRCRPVASSECCWRIRQASGLPVAPPRDGAGGSETFGAVRVGRSHAHAVRWTRWPIASPDGP